MYFLGYPPGVAVAMAAMLIIALAVRRRRLPPEDLLAHARAIVDRDLPLAHGLAAAARSMTGKSARSMRQLAEHLVAGDPFHVAARLRCPGLSEMEVGVLAAGEQTGTLSRALAVLTRGRRRRGPPATGLVFILAYAAFLVLVLCYAMLFILPQFRNIFVDFDATLPPSTRRLMAAGDWFAEVGWAVALLAILAGGGAIVLSLWRRRSAARPRLVSRLRDRFAWRMPFFGREHRWRQWAVALDAWAMMTRAGMDAPAALAEVSRIDLNVVLRRLLADWSAHAAAGEPIEQCRAMAAAPKMARWLIAAAARDGGLADALERAADYCRDQHSRVAAVLRGGSVAVAVLAGALLIGSFCYALFTPLVELIRASAQVVSG